jgi:hypothetical protein
MPYNLTLTDGTSLVSLADNARDTTHTDITLIGKNFSGYGLYLNENFIKILENFSSATAPSNPLPGQIWWDSTNKHLSVCTQTNPAVLWKVISSSQTGASAPVQPVTGDFWWDTNASTFKVYSGSTWVSIGPISPPGFATTEFRGNALLDNSSTPHLVGNATVNNKLATVTSSDSVPFTLPSALSGLTRINPGINFTNTVESSMISSANVTFGVTSGNAQISTALNTGFIVQTNVNGTITNSLYANAASGLVTVSGNPTTALGVATKGYVDTANVDLKSYVDSRLTGITGGGGTTSFSANVIPTANLTYNLGAPDAWWNNIYGTAVHAKYADLAERFEADAHYEPGTVLEIGGEKEVTQVGHDLSENVFGVISTNAAYLMNSGAGTNSTHPPVAVQGRVPVKVIGRIRKGDRLVSAGNGMARAGARSEITTWNVIGRALEHKLDDGIGTIEAVVKLNS